MGNASALLLGRWKSMLLIYELYRYVPVHGTTTGITSKSTLLEVSELRRNV